VELAGLPPVDKAVESIEGDSYAALFDAHKTPDPESPGAAWANEWNASFTQYPRCTRGGAVPKTAAEFVSGAQRCTSVKKQDFVFMGYSARTVRGREAGAGRCVCAGTPPAQCVQ
jgi:hypothetical protein